MTIYKVITPTEVRAVKAKSKTQAINHVTRAGVYAETVTPDELWAMLQVGCKG